MQIMPCLIQAGYDALWWAATPLLHRHLQKRVTTDKEDAARLGERFGITSVMRPNGKLVWLHGASVGESVALLPVIARLRAEANPPTLLITTGTVTSAKIMKDRLPQGCIHQYLPLDRKAWVEKFLDHWQPDGVIWCESEIWPRVFASLKARNIPSIMLNLRLSARTVRNWRWAKSWMLSLLSIFSFTAAQTETDQHNWHELGGPPAQLMGNIKFVGEALPCDMEKLAVLNGEIGNRSLWAFSSIHPGEESIGGRVHAALKQVLPDVLTILIPRHPFRGVEFASTLKAQGLNVALRSAGEAVTRTTDIYLADTIGEVGLFYRLCKVIAIGGSFVPHGGQNPIEAVKLEAAIVYGSYMFNFTAICAAFEQASAVRVAADEASLIKAVQNLLQHPAEAQKLGTAAHAVTLAEADSLDKIWAAIAPWRKQVLV